MHEWHTEHSRNILSLITEFTGFEFDTDYSGRLKTSEVRITGKIFPSHDEALTFVTDRSYGSNTPYLAAYTTKKLSKGYQNAYADFIKKYNEYLNFDKNLTIAYGRKASKVTCPHCNSSINLHYGQRFKACPVCGSSKIISDSNWRTRDTKYKMVKKAAENLSKEAEKIDLTFVCGLEWHC